MRERGWSGIAWLQMWGKGHASVLPFSKRPPVTGKTRLNSRRINGLFQLLLGLLPGWGHDPTTAGDANILTTNHTHAITTTALNLVVGWLPGAVAGLLEFYQGLFSFLPPPRQAPHQQAAERSSSS